MSPLRLIAKSQGEETAEHPCGDSRLILVFRNKTGRGRQIADSMGHKSSRNSGIITHTNFHNTNPTPKAQTFVRRKKGETLCVFSRSVGCSSLILIYFRSFGLFSPRGISQCFEPDSYIIIDKIHFRCICQPRSRSCAASPNGPAVVSPVGKLFLGRRNEST